MLCSWWIDVFDVLVELSREVLDVIWLIDLLVKLFFFVDFFVLGVLIVVFKDDLKGFLVVLGVFVELKEVKVLDFRLKVFDVLFVGDVKLFFGVVMELKGLVFWSEELLLLICLKELLCLEGLLF